MVDAVQPGPVMATSMKKAPHSARERQALGEGEQGEDRPAISEEGWNYTIGLRLFQVGDLPENPFALPVLKEAAAPLSMPGHVFQAARQLCGLSQRDLSDGSKVSRQRINDFENGFTALSPRLMERLFRVLRGRGVQFVEGEGVVGAVVTQPRHAFDETSRSPKKISEA